MTPATTAAAVAAPANKDDMATTAAAAAANTNEDDAATPSSNEHDAGNHSCQHQRG